MRTRLRRRRRRAGEKREICGLLQSRAVYPTCAMAARPWYLPLVLALVAPACTAWKVDYRRAQAQKAVPRGPVPTLVGKRCADASCRCRGAKDAAEEPPPPPGKKRLEIRMSAANGRIALDSPSAGHFQQDGPQEACFYVDLEVDAVHDFHLDSREETSGV